MHDLLHLVVLIATLAGAGCLALLALWPLVSDAPLAPRTRGALAAGVAAGLVMLAVEWRLVH